jgi:hypothetical protein
MEPEIDQPVSCWATSAARKSRRPSASDRVMRKRTEASRRVEPPNRSWSTSYAV